MITELIMSQSQKAHKKNLRVSLHGNQTLMNRNTYTHTDIEYVYKDMQ